MNLLPRLLNFSLFGGENPITGISTPIGVGDWEALLEESQSQGVTSLLYDAILQLPSEQRPPRSVLFHFASLTQTIEQNNRQLVLALRHFSELTSEQLGLDTVVVKGVSLARLYPNSLHRERGDNDLFTGSDTVTVNAMVESLGISVDRRDPRHSAFTFDGADFECHSYLLYGGDDLDWQTIPFSEKSVHLRRLVPEQEALFLAKHSEHHAVFFHNPVRLRSLVDWGLLVTSANFDYDRFCELKQDTDVEYFADLMTLYCHRLFGVKVSCGIKTIERRLKSKGLSAEDFFTIYMQCPKRHPNAIVRVARRSGKYLRYGKKYRALYGMSMFRRFYLHNLAVAIGQHLPNRAKKVQKNALSRHNNEEKQAL